MTAKTISVKFWTVSRGALAFGASPAYLGSVSIPWEDATSISDGGLVLYAWSIAGETPDDVAIFALVGNDLRAII